jgi:GPH family glycoside/pentoside/hexuronide:cation symporter
MLVTALITVFTVKEPPRAAAEATEQQGFFTTWGAALGNRPFVLTFLTYACHIAGTVIVQSTLIYYFKYIYGDEGGLQIALALLLAPVIPSIWVWTALSKKIGKKWAWNIGMGLVVLAVAAIFLFAREAGQTFFYVVMAAAGIGLATNYVMPYAVIPDTVELDYARTGVRREGAFYGVFNFMNKVGAALGTFLSGIVLSAFGYVANVEQTETSKLGIQLLVGPIGGLFFLAGVIVMAFYPITRRYYDTEILPKVAEWDRKRKS